MSNIAPSLTDDAAFRRWFERAQRLACSPADGLWRRHSNFELDLRDVLPSIQAPTLVVYRRGINFAEQSRYLATHIPGARCMELPGEDFLPFVGDMEPLLDAIEEFLTGELPVHDTERILATILFTDIVGSTERAAALGDRRWRTLLETHHAVVQTIVDRHRGRCVKTTGDGVLATFDGPGRAIRCAFALHEAVRPLGIELRAGIHTGEVEIMGEDVGGIAVHIAARVMNNARLGEVVVSGAIPPLVAGSEINFVDRGEHELRGVPGTWKLYAVEG